MATKKRGTGTARKSKATGKRATAGRRRRNNHLSGHDWGRIVAKAWRDEDFKNRLQQDPTATIREFMPEHEGPILEIPERPTELKDSQLDDIIRGKSNMYHCSNLC